MGYRSRLGRVKKTEKVRFAGKTCSETDEILGEDDPCYRPTFHTELYQLGKYCDFEIKPEQFYDFDIEKACECEFHILGRDGLKQIIAEYHEHIVSNYKQICETGDWRIFIEERHRAWGVYSEGKFKLLPYLLDEAPEKSDGNIVNSWSYEYAIFELVYIYRTFDWQNDYLIYSAW